MKTLSQSPTDPKFVQDPYSFYEQARETAADAFWWQEYEMPAILSYDMVSKILRDRRFGREAPSGLEPEKPNHQKDFWAIEDHSMLELEAPRHTRLRKLVLHAFTSRRVAALAPEIDELATQLARAMPAGGANLLPHFAEKLPVIIIARLLGVPESDADQLLIWSHAMVAMYQANRNHETEVAASNAARDFAQYIREVIARKRTRPGDDLITHLIAAEEDGTKLSTDELIATCVLLLNAGHEATVHTIGNGVAAILKAGTNVATVPPEKLVEEILRYDTPLHMFQRWAYDDIQLGDLNIQKNTKVACLLGAANRDPARWSDAATFDPCRAIQTNASFGAGAHFCIGAPLARLELIRGLPILFERHPHMRLMSDPEFSDSYHFHGLSELRVSY